MAKSVNEYEEELRRLREENEKLKSKRGPKKSYKPEIQTKKTGFEFTMDTYKALEIAIVECIFPSRNTLVNAAIRQFLGLKNEDQNVINY